MHCFALKRSIGNTMLLRAYELASYFVSEIHISGRTGGVFSLAGPVAETFVYVGILVHPAKQKHNELKTAARHGAAAAAHPTERVGGRCCQMRARRIANIQLHLDQVKREPRKG